MTAAACLGTMRTERSARIDGFETWRAEARRLLGLGVPPELVEWDDGSGQLGLGLGVAPEASAAPGADAAATSEAHAAAPADTTAAARVPRSFLDTARRVACHSDPDRWALLYRLLWRLSHEGGALWEASADADVHRARTLEAAVRRDVHQMHAFVRFTRLDGDGDGGEGEGGRGEHWVAWYRPDHHIAELAAPFFVDRFRSMRWSILGPEASVHWDGEALAVGPGVPRRDAPRPDEMVELWRAYYRATFNPARLRVETMRQHMPTRRWGALPEAVEIAGLAREAPDRAREMRVPAPRLLPVLPLPDDRSLPALREAARSCQGCDIHRNATQTVFGEGPSDARLVLVGEQPGDQEDLAGHPFVGPAGKVLDGVLEEVGLSRDRIYVTNAVKHFKWEPRGKKRIHSRPSHREIDVCKDWLLAELEALRPEALVCLGASAAQALFGKTFRLTRTRGRIFETAWAKVTLATYHPSAVLRADTPTHSDEVRAALREDLGRVADLLRGASAVPG